MCQTPDWSVGDRYLRENVPELAPLVDRYSPCPLKPKSKEVYFTILLTGIIAQHQLQTRYDFCHLVQS